MGKRGTAISPTREENYSEWYLQVIKESELAEHSAVRGCMIIRPWGYSLWENCQKSLDDKFKQTGHENAYFPLFIPLSYLEKEAEHVDGFAKECAVVTHSKLEKDADGKLVPSSALEEPLVVRPTSEMIIGESFARWIQSYRDMPLLINQWANVVRWEMRTRLFLRTAEFLWQEGHTVHATAEEAWKEVRLMHKIYKDFAENELAVPALAGDKTESERFPGAESTLTLEAMMQDGKALQLGTVHFLGQNFSKASNIQFANDKGEQEYAWTTSWGVTTRLIGALLMTHSDDNGLVLPPRIANIHCVILPIVRKNSNGEEILRYCEELKSAIEKLAWHGKHLDARVDDREIGGGEKRWSWIKKGVPLIIEVGQKELDSGTVTFACRDKLEEKKQNLGKNEFVEALLDTLSALQDRLLAKAKSFQKKNTKWVSSEKEFYEFFQSKIGFAMGFWSEDKATEEKIKRDLKVSVRCVPFEKSDKLGPCLFTGKADSRVAVFAKAY